jgi:hypothetical protein
VTSALIHRKYPYLTLTTISLFIISAVAAFILGSQANQIIDLNPSNKPITQIITDTYTQNPAISLITIAIILTGLIIYNGEGYTKVEV